MSNEATLSVAFSYHRSESPSLLGFWIPDVTPWVRPDFIREAEALLTNRADWNPVPR